MGSELDRVQKEEKAQQPVLFEGKMLLSNQVSRTEQIRGIVDYLKSKLEDRSNFNSIADLRDFASDVEAKIAHLDAFVPGRPLISRRSRIKRIFRSSS